MKWIKVDQLIFDNTKKTPLNFHIYLKNLTTKKKPNLIRKLDNWVKILWNFIRLKTSFGWRFFLKISVEFNKGFY